MSVSGDGGIELADAFGGVNHQQRNVGGFQVLARHHDGELFRHQVGLALAANAGGIDEAEALAVVLDDLVNRVPRGAGDGRDNGSLGSGQPVQQSGFAHVGMPDDRNLGFVRLGLRGCLGIFLRVLSVLRGQLMVRAAELPARRPADHPARAHFRRRSGNSLRIPSR